MWHVINKRVGRHTHQLGAGHLLPGHAHPVLHHAQGGERAEQGQAVHGIADCKVAEPQEAPVREGGSLGGQGAGVL